MKVRLSNQKLSIIAGIFSKIGKVKSSVNRWEIALRIYALASFMDALETAKTKPASVVNLTEKRQKVYNKYGIVDGKKFRIPEENLHQVYKELLEIKVQNPSDVKEEERYLEDIGLLMLKEVEIELEPIEHSWCEDLIDANEVVLLMSVGLIKE